MHPLPDGTTVGTVRDWDAVTGAGSVLLDDGRAVAFPGPAYRASGLVRLRPGQRVHLVVEGGTVTLVTIGTLETSPAADPPLPPAAGATP